jgi:hypothetical protein
MGGVNVEIHQNLMECVFVYNRSIFYYMQRIRERKRRLGAEQFITVRHSNRTSLRYKFITATLTTNLKPTAAPIKNAT